MGGDHHGFTHGEKVNYVTTGRYPTHVNGAVAGSDGAWLLISDGTGKVRKTRPGPVKRGHA